MDLLFFVLLWNGEFLPFGLFLFILIFVLKLIFLLTILRIEIGEIFLFFGIFIFSFLEFIISVFLFVELAVAWLENRGVMIKLLALFLNN